MSIDEIMNGSSEKSFPGLLPLIQDYLRNIEVDTDTMCTLSRYWIYLQRKAQCRIMTNARFMREFVQKVSTFMVCFDVPKYDWKVTYFLHLFLASRLSKGFDCV